MIKCIITKYCMPTHIFHRPAHYGDRTVSRMLLPSFHFGDKGDKTWTRRHVCLIYPTAVLKHLYSQTLFWRLLRSSTKEKKNYVLILKNTQAKKESNERNNNKQQERSKSVSKPWNITLNLMLAKQARQLRQCSLNMRNPKMAKACTLTNDNLRHEKMGGLRGMGPLPSPINCCLGKGKYLTSSDKEYNDGQTFCNIDQKSCEYFGWLTFSVKPCCALQFRVMSL